MRVASGLALVSPRQPRQSHPDRGVRPSTGLDKALTGLTDKTSPPSTPDRASTQRAAASAHTVCFRSTYSCGVPIGRAPFPGASLPGSLAASDTLGSARSGFEAAPVVDADHGKSESHRRRRRGRCCGGGKVQEGAGHLAGALRAADGASTRCRGARRQDQGAQRRARLDQQRSARRRTGCVAAALPAAYAAQDSRWLQDSADSVAWAAHGMPESPHGISRPG